MGIGKQLVRQDIGRAEIRYKGCIALSSLFHLSIYQLVLNQLLQALIIILQYIGTFAQI